MTPEINPTPEAEDDDSTSQADESADSQPGSEPLPILPRPPRHMMRKKRSTALPVDREVVRADYLTGATARELSARYRVGLTTVQKWISRYNWNQERANVMARTEARLEGAITEVIKAYQQQVADECAIRIANLRRMESGTIRATKEFAQALDVLDRVWRRQMGLDLAAKGSATAVGVSVSISDARVPSIDIESKTVNIEQVMSDSTVSQKTGNSKNL